MFYGRFDESLWSLYTIILTGWMIQQQNWPMCSRPMSQLGDEVYELLICINRQLGENQVFVSG